MVLLQHSCLKKKKDISAAYQDLSPPALFVSEQDYLKIARVSLLSSVCPLNEIAKHGQGKLEKILVFPTSDWQQQQQQVQLVHSHGALGFLLYAHTWR